MLWYSVMTVKSDRFLETFINVRKSPNYQSIYCHNPETRNINLPSLGFQIIVQFNFN
jgi:hypothetical protein